MEDTKLQPGPFASDLKRRRSGIPMSMKELGRRSNVSEGRIRQIEKGWQDTPRGKRPTETNVATVVKLAKALEWDIDDALTQAGFDPTDVVIPDDVDITPPAELSELWNDLTVQQRKAILNVAVLFVDSKAAVDAAEPSGMMPTFPPLGEAVEVKTRARRR